MTNSRSIALFAKVRLASILLGSAASAGYSMQSSAQSPATDDQALTEVTVTGSRIRGTDGMAEPTPVTTISPVDLANYEPGSTIAEQLDALPQFYNTGSAQRGGPALFGDGGGSYLDMRGLGRNRTLVLFDGLRVPPADKRGQVNVDTLPTALIRSVDVVTGGASAAYGADALGGVTNFQLDRNYKGLKLKVSAGMNEFHSDGKNYSLSAAGGTKIGERLSVLGSVETRHVDQITRLAEDLDPSWFKRWGYVNNPAYKASDPPGTNPQRLVTPWVAPAGLHVNGVIRPGPFGVLGPSQLANKRFTDDGSALVPFAVGCTTDGSVIADCEDAYTSNVTQPSGLSGSEVRQTNIFLSAKFALTDSLDVFVDYLKGSVESNGTNLISGATWTSIWSPTVFRENAYLPASVRSIMQTENRASFKIGKGGSYPGVLDVDTGRESRNTFDTHMARVGVDWDIDGNWQLRFSAQTGRTKKLTGDFDSLRIDRVNLAIDAVEVYKDKRDVNGDGIIDLVAEADRGTGTIVCNVQRYNPTPAQLAATPAIQGQVSSRDQNLPLASPVGLDNTISGCVPFNIMGNGQISQAAHDYISTPKYGIGIVDQDYSELLVTGDLWQGWGAGPLSLAGGLNYRKQSFSDEGFPVDVDTLGPPFNAPELGIRGIASAWSGGSPNLHQFSTVSLLTGKYDVWEAFGEFNVPIWKSQSGIQRLGSSLAYRSSDYSTIGRVESWKVGLDFQILRDVRLRATRSRDVREATFSERFDNSPNGGTIILDPQTGLSNVVVTSTAAGNPALRPEVADTTVFGIVYEPSWFPGLRMSLDHYRVDIGDSIATLEDDAIVDECFFNKVLCEYVIRDSGGNLTRVLRPYLNLDQAFVEGTDIEVDYRRGVNWFNAANESFSVRFLGGRLDHRSNTVKGSVPDEFAGSLGFPHFTASASATYAFSNWSIQLQERFISEVKLDRRWTSGVEIDDNSIDAKKWTNLVVGYEGRTFHDATWRVNLNVQNLFDDDPAIIPGTGGGRFGGQLVNNAYDLWGRRYQLTFSVEL